MFGNKWRKGSTELATPKNAKKDSEKRYFGKCKSLLTRAKARKKRKRKSN